MNTSATASWFGNRMLVHVGTDTSDFIGFYLGGQVRYISIDVYNRYEGDADKISKHYDYSDY